MKKSEKVKEADEVKAIHSKLLMREKQLSDMDSTLEDYNQRLGQVCK